MQSKEEEKDKSKSLKIEDLELAQILEADPVTGLTGENVKLNNERSQLRDFGLTQNKVDSYTQCLVGFMEAQSASKIPIT